MEGTAVPNSTGIFGVENGIVWGSKEFDKEQSREAKRKSQRDLRACSS